MSQQEGHLPGWDRDAARALRDQRVEFDDEREHCPVSYSSIMHWSVLRHAEVMRVLLDHDTFSNVVSRHVSVPNGMDPPEHTIYRDVIVPYFADDRMRAFEPDCRALFTAMVAELPKNSDIELMGDFARHAAARSHCLFLGWPLDLESVLASWTVRSTEATRSQNRQELVAIANEFEALVTRMIADRRQNERGDDVMSRLMRERVNDRLLNSGEITSILRNWTVGEIATVAASIGILAAYLAQHTKLQEEIRANRSLLPEAIDEILRIDGPLVANRRVTTCPVEIGGETIAAGERVSINWIAANRDGRVFEHPAAFRFGRNPEHNLLYGAGIHVCPGAPLARMELRLVMDALLDGSSWIEPGAAELPARASYPASGFTHLPLRLRA